MKRLIVCLLLLSGCAAPQVARQEKGSADAPTSGAAPAMKVMFVYIPQTDESAVGWISWFDRHPTLRMVIAMSPRFTKMARDPALKAQMLSLKKEGRLEFALQIPNAPILPLLVSNPPYGYPDDVIQLMAFSKAGFFKNWNMLPQGLVLPYGASSAKLMAILEKLGIFWVVGATGLPPADGSSQSGPMKIWNGNSASPPAPLPPGEGGRRPGDATQVRVWDERQNKEWPIDTMVMEVKAKGGVFILPGDPIATATLVPLDASWKQTTWDGKDWSSWMGDPVKDAAWQSLRKTRETLERYKNSGQASVQKMDLAFDQLYSAQNSNYFSTMGNFSATPALAEERMHEFQATLSAVYRIIGRQPPEDLFTATDSVLPMGALVSSTSITAEVLPSGSEHLVIQDASADAMSPAGSDLKSVEILSSTTSIHWAITVISTAVPVINLFMDLNSQPNAGTPSLLSYRDFVASASDAWEYALEITGASATLYRTQGVGTYGTVQMFPVVMDGVTAHVRIPREILRGSPRRWGYQALVIENGVLSDFIDPFEISQNELWQDLAAGTRNDIPFIRAPRK